MECSLGHSSWEQIQDNRRVLILILMECSLGILSENVRIVDVCLNPYSNGMLTWQN